MKILVPIKRVVDYNTKIRVKDDGSDIENTNLRMSINPFDEIALEEAVLQKEKGCAKEIVAVTCGTPQSIDVLRTAMAMGADRSILVSTQENLTSLIVAKLLVKIVEQEKPDLIILGKQATDDDASQTGQMLASLLDYPQATAVSRLTIENKVAQVEREADDGVEYFALKLPALITTDLRLNEPRYVTLPNMMKARKKEITTLTPQTLGVDVVSKLKRIRVSEPAKRAAVCMVSDVQTLMEKLKNEAKVIK